MSLRKSLIIIFCALLCLPLAGKASKAPLKVGTYNLCTSDSRVKSLKKGKFKSTQKYWCNSAVAVAAMINDLDCDVLGMQEVCDSIWGVKGNYGLQKLCAAASGGERYGWICYPNTKKGTISYDDAICYRKDRLTELESGIFYLGGNPDKPVRVSGAPKGTARPCVWARFKDKTTGKKFFFVSVHLVLGSMYKDGGTEYNAARCIEYLTEQIIPRKVPSIIVGDFNAESGSKAFDVMCSSWWMDAYLFLKGEDKLGENELKAGTQPKKDESGFGKWRPDHIMFSRHWTPSDFHIDRRMFPTADGSLHFPSDHLPVVCTLNLK